jgi:hypothetical protein
MAVLDSALEWLKTGQGQIAIHDATNSTRDRRSKLLQRISQFPGIEPLFIESILTDPQMIETNIQLKVNSPDYKYKHPHIILHTIPCFLSFFLGHGLFIGCCSECDFVETRLQRKLSLIFEND